MNKEKRIIPIFFAIDDSYTPFLAVALQSLIDNASKEYNYLIKILHTNVQEENQKQIKKFESENVNIEYVDLSYYIEKVKDKLYTRDYYTNTTYFRLFLPELYPQYDKVLYLDSDIIVVGDISELYNTEMGTNLVAAAPDDNTIQQSIPRLCRTSSRSCKISALLQCRSTTNELRRTKKIQISRKVLIPIRKSKIFSSTRPRLLK